MKGKPVALLIFFVTMGLLIGTVFAGTPATAKLKTPVIAFIDFDKAGQEFTE